MADVAGNLPHARIGRGTMEDGVEQDDLANAFRGTGWPREGPSLEKFLAKLGAEETASARDDDFHA
jgi:hypothetical protein